VPAGRTGQTIQTNGIKPSKNLSKYFNRNKIVKARQNSSLKNIKELVGRTEIGGQK